MVNASFATTPLMIAAIAVLGLLQIIFIVLTLNTRAMVKKMAGKNAGPESRNQGQAQARDNQSHPRPHRDGHDNRPRRQSLEPPRQQSSMAPPRVENEAVEKSLRDINLRLKNAERDQEKARKSIQTTVSPVGSPDSTPTGNRFESRDREGPRRDNREGRDRPGSRDSRDRNRGDREGGRRDFSRRNDRNGPPRDSQAPQNRPVAPLVETASPKNETVSTEITPKIFASSQPETASIPFTMAPRQGQNDVVEISEKSDVVDYGRKSAVKRRVLKAGEEEQAGNIADTTVMATSSVEAAVPQIEGSQSGPVEPSESKDTFANVTFGRR